MTQRERQGWIIVAALWVTLFLVFGAASGTGAIFFMPLLKEFHWSRAQLSMVQGGFSLMTGLCSPLIGALLDRIEARIVMVAGVACAGIAFLLASQAHSFAPLLGAYVLLGAGVCASATVPCTFVLANWFGNRRGTAMGIMFTGQSAGASALALVVNFVIIRSGWRAGYIVLAVPMVVILIPLILIIVRSRPPQAENVSIRVAGTALPGFTLGEAASTRSFWAILLGQFIFGFCVSAMALHLVAYLIGIGYSRTAATEYNSLVWICSALGKFCYGAISDRLTARIALFVNLTLCAFGVLLLHGALNPLLLLGCVLIWGTGSGSPVVLLSLLTADSLGLKRFGSISGITGMLMTFGAALGPVFAGRVFDLTHSYMMAFDIIAAMYAVGAIAVLTCRRFAAEQSLRVPAEAVA